jgi:imidazolonepropionase-like amidohydrolase
MQRVLYGDAAVVDDETRGLRRGVSILVEGDRIVAITPTDDEGAADGAEVVDAGGTTAVAGLVDAHSHLTLPGGAHWIDRGFDPTDRLLEAAEHNATLLRQAGVRWARDVGGPMRDDAEGGRERALSLTVRDR